MQTETETETETEVRTLAIPSREKRLALPELEDECSRMQGGIGNKVR